MNSGHMKSAPAKFVSDVRPGTSKRNDDSVSTFSATDRSEYSQVCTSVCEDRKREEKQNWENLLSRTTQKTNRSERYDNDRTHDQSFPRIQDKRSPAPETRKIVLLQQLFRGLRRNRGEQKQAFTPIDWIPKMQY